MRKKFFLLFVILCCMLNIFIYFITKNESRTINSILVSAITSGMNENDTYDTENSDKIDNENVENLNDKNADNNEFSEAETQNSDYSKDVEKDDTEVRVLISTSNYASLYHNEIKFENADGMIIEYGESGENNTKISSDEELVINENSKYFTADTIYICPATDETNDDNTSGTKITSITRNCGTPEYYGSFEVKKTSDGLLLINIVPQEIYICSVVLSELNSSFPEEALKTQAVCARTYLYYIKQLGKYSEYDADIEDSKNCQVYNNNSFSEMVKNAISDTQGEIIVYNGEVINAVYFSTSCGVTTNGHIFNKDDMNYTQSIYVSNALGNLDLKEEADFQKFIDDAEKVVVSSNINSEELQIYDSTYPYYRWSVTESIDEIRSAIKTATSNDVGVINKITPGSRLEGGVLNSITVYGSNKTIVITGQDNIRAAFCKSGVTAKLNDGSTVNINSLPSAFFYITAQYNDGNLSGYKFNGGGFGHGCGMSQNAAKKMAEQGMTYKEIINFFYNNVEIVNYSS